MVTITKQFTVIGTAICHTMVVFCKNITIHLKQTTLLQWAISLVSKLTLVENTPSVSWCEFAYIMQDGVWYVMFQGDSNFYLLSKELAKEKDTVEVV